MEEQNNMSAVVLFETPAKYDLYSVIYLCLDPAFCITAALLAPDTFVRIFACCLLAMIVLFYLLNLPRSYQVVLPERILPERKVIVKTLVYERSMDALSPEGKPRNEYFISSCGIEASDWLGFYAALNEDDVPPATVVFGTPVKYDCFDGWTVSYILPLLFLGVTVFLLSQFHEGWMNVMIVEGIVFCLYIFLHQPISIQVLSDRNVAIKSRTGQLTIHNIVQVTPYPKLSPFLHLCRTPFPFQANYTAFAKARDALLLERVGGLASFAISPVDESGFLDAMDSITQDKTYPHESEPKEVCSQNLGDYKLLHAAANRIVYNEELTRGTFYMQSYIGAP